MGVLIKCNDATFENTVGLAGYPIIGTLKNLYYFGGTEANSTKDHSGNDNTGTVVGTITINTKTATFATSGTSNLIKAQNTTESITKVAAVALVKKTGNRGIVCCVDGSAGFAFGTERVLYKTASSYNNKNSIALPDANGFYPLAWTINDSGLAMYRLNSNGELATLASQSGDALVMDGSKINFGGMSYNFSATGTAEIAVCAYYEGDVTTTQLTDALNFLKNYGEANGLTVL